MTLQNWQVELADAILLNETSSLVTPSALLNIHHHTAISSLIRTLQTTYPLVVKLVGDVFFQMIAKEYIHHYPSRSGDLHDYGEYLNDFLIDYPPVKALVYLAEVATFEWACHMVMIAADHVELDINRLASIPPENFSALQLALHPACYLMKCHYPIFRIIDLCHEKNMGEIHLDEGGVDLLIYRRHVDIALIPLTLAEFIFLNEINNGQCVNQATELALQHDSAFNLEVKLPQWVQDKIIVDFNVV